MNNEILLIETSPDLWQIANCPNETAINLAVDSLVLEHAEAIMPSRLTVLPGEKNTLNTLIKILEHQGFPVKSSPLSADEKIIRIWKSSSGVYSMRNCPQFLARYLAKSDYIDAKPAIIMPCTFDIVPSFFKYVIQYLEENNIPFEVE